MEEKREIENTQDWLDGFYYGKQVCMEEIMKQTLPIMKEMTENLNCTSSLIDEIRQVSDERIKKLRKALL